MATRAKADSMLCTPPSGDTVAPKQIESLSVRSSHVDEIEKSNLPKEDGAMAWTFAFASFLLYFLAWGPVVAFGLFQDYYKRELLQTYSASTISWIGTLESFFLISTGVVAGPLFDAGYLRHLMTLGCLMTVFGMMMLSLSTQYYQIILAQGVCMGVGSGLVYVPGLALTTKLFNKRKALAIGFVTSGVSCAGVIFPIIFLKLQPQIGFAWTVRVLGFVQFFCMLVALPLFMLGPPARPSPPRQMVHWHAFKQVAFSSYFVAGFLIFMAYLIPLTFISTFSNAVLGSSSETGYYQLAASNAASMVGRIGAPLFAPSVGGPNMLMASVISSAIVLYGWTGVTSDAGLWVWAIMFGLCSGTLVSANPLVVSHPVISSSPKVIGTRLGMQWTGSSFGILVGSPIAGTLLVGPIPVRNQYIHLQVFSASIMAGAALALIWPVIAIRKYDRRSE